MSNSSSSATGFQKFVQHDAAPGVILFLAAILALILDNSSLAWLYDGLLVSPMKLQVGALIIAKLLLLQINDGLMAIFFFFVALEIKRELMDGYLSDPREAALPAIAAVGGMAMPALVFVFFNWGSPEEMRGQAIPAATDIAFALGVLALLGKSVPASLKIFLLSLAIIDDLGAIVIIAVFYTADFSVASLATGGIGLAALVAMNTFGVTEIAPYIVVGIVMWVCVLKSGVHATLAGELLGFTIPMSSKNGSGTPLLDLEHALKPWVAFVIMPIFAFANAGISLAGLSVADLLEPLPLGIALGLFVGKQLGVFGFAWITTKTNICRLPKGSNFKHIYGVALLAGIGFTMSLFIGTLAFDDPEHARAVRIGVLSGSIVSGIVGYLILRFGGRSSAETGTASSAA